MLSLQKRRSALRSVFTKEANSLRELLKSEDASPTELRARLQTLTNRFSNLKSADEKILLNLEDEDGAAGGQDGENLEKILEDEMTACGEYELTFQRLNEEISQRLAAPSAQSMVSAVDDHAGPTRVLKLRRPDIKKFGGEIKHWISFWAQFSKIDEDISLQNEDKFAFLLEALIPGSPAQKLVEGFPPSRENYQKAIDLLKARYGKEELLIEYYVRELLSLVLKRAENTVSQLYDQLEAQLRALDSLGVTKEKYAAMIFPLVESSVPENVFKVWERHRISKNASIMDAEGCLTELLSFLRVEVEGEERLKLRQNTFEEHARTRGCSQAQKISKPSQKIPSAAALVSTDSPSKIIACLFCEKSHNSSECAKAVDMTTEEKNDFIKRKGACFKCLKPGHLSSNWRAFLKCLVCKGRHFPIMCQKIHLEDAEVSKSHGKLGSEKIETKTLVAGLQIFKTVYLQTLVAKIVANGREISVRILIDSGSQKSYILKAKAKECNLRRLGKTLVQQELFGGQKSALKSHGVYKILLKSFTSPFQYEFEVLDQEKICGFVP
ncbi:Retrotransposon protein [Nesidiocoris tenuis]|uniref:Retrotransposon protein n=1 Tax=Nesidiocoris tenuis TaxID=355587 RepID=A0ABN7AB70_9HEMI|nr:Retrotransposon protein [Nesidiocoris tenuis]